ncbi:Imm63 family immunity protein [Mycobacterium avium]|uniref:Imm63 family immunity protein n=1 Tax=Mycobacterium avium TaxID=1764 RepID=UPI0001B59E42|nr:Imm63 family immunity protein [Mycobacterium avium]ETB12357.1 hypothetical protein O972_21700 [Mycobacterium avium subsp. avium 10-9275]ETB17831.1 hypothetical protein O973_20705 [Mycobacterium avium subsp. avium 11-4751]ANR91587.1 hypothetical protein BBJ32_10020 [Mycobacterium avium]AYJ03389.1 hypothetical protein DBO90_00130 [Mycobacterium avium]MDV3265910.1 immunity 63 family protein [Mycobacterium avium]
MVDGKTAHLQAEVDRIAARLNVPPIKVGVVLKNDDHNIYIDDDGRYHYDYWERGRQGFDRVGDIDEALYGFATDAAFDIGYSYSARFSPPDQDRRILLWAKQYELLNQLNPGWAKRCVRERADQLRGWGLHEAVELLPDIPERDG